jgi:hypothetical protein
VSRCLAESGHCAMILLSVTCNKYDSIPFFRLLVHYTSTTTTTTNTSTTGNDCFYNDIRSQFCGGKKGKIYSDTPTKKLKYGSYFVDAIFLFFVLVTHSASRVPNGCNSLRFQV